MVYKSHLCTIGFQDDTSDITKLNFVLRLDMLGEMNSYDVECQHSLLSRSRHCSRIAVRSLMVSALSIAMRV